MEPYSSPYIIPNNSLHNQFPHSLLSTRESDDPSRSCDTKTMDHGTLNGTLKMKHTQHLRRRNLKNAPKKLEEESWRFVRRGPGVDGGHQALDNAELLVNNLPVVIYG